MWQQYLLPREMRPSADTLAVLHAPHIARERETVCVCAGLRVRVRVCDVRERAERASKRREAARVRESESGCFFERVRESERVSF